MVTLFSMPKPFRGDIGLIQRNAIESWTLLRPRPEVILLGDEEGTADLAASFGARHVPGIARNEFGTPLVNSIFESAEQIASHEVLCYVNTDIILMSDFVPAVRRMRFPKFLMIGQRWDLDVCRPLDFRDPAWEAVFWRDVLRRG